MSMMTSNSNPNSSKVNSKSQMNEVSSVDRPKNSENLSKKESSAKDDGLSSVEVSEGHSIDLPEPDADNITVLSNKLPNTPILPWNRYDSPWEPSENSSEITVNSDSEKEESE